MSDSPLETETLHDTTTFEFFDREWTVPTKRHLSHLRKMRDELRGGWVDINLTVAETFLSADQFRDLLAIDPNEDDLNDFVGHISKALGLGSTGNSKPSSASS